MHKKHWIIFLSFIFLLSILFIVIQFFFQKGTIAEIYQNGSLLYQIDLSTVSTPYTIPITYESGENIILVEENHISVLSATCPDQTCVHQGKINSGVVPIVCLPHHLVIEIKKDKSDSLILSH